ncbi:glycine-rich protein [Brevibacillus centrosporus]|uniref:hypothetical protein n=1 Tax=Brevibacillus centrosporus TaxID=54910 RepID=UPI003D1AB090
MADEYGQAYTIVNGKITYEFTASTSFTVPSGGDIQIEAYGSAGTTGGSNGSYNIPGGKGAYVIGTLNGVTQGEILTVTAGGGVSGKAADVRRGGTGLNNRIIVAGAGGGSPYLSSNYYPNYVNLSSGADSGSSRTYSGRAGTQSAGGAGIYGGSNGTFGYGGSGTGNGGDGWYGGGGGGYYSDTSSSGTTTNRMTGGGGGSSYIGSLTNASIVEGQNTGEAKVIITILNSAPSITISSPADNQTLLQVTRLASS